MGRERERVRKRGRESKLLVVVVDWLLVQLKLFKLVLEGDSLVAGKLIRP